MGRCSSPMLDIGARAPDFTARTTSGESFSLSQAAGRPVAVYFFPRAFTAG